MQETLVRLLGQEDPLEKGMATHSRSGLENSMDPIVHGVAKSQTWLSDFHHKAGTTLGTVGKTENRVIIDPPHLECSVI